MPKKSSKYFIGIAERYLTCDSRSYYFCVYKKGESLELFFLIEDLAKFLNKEFDIKSKKTFKIPKPIQENKEHCRIAMFRFHPLNKLQRRQLKKLIRGKGE